MPDLREQEAAEMHYVVYICILQGCCCTVALRASGAAVSVPRCLDLEDDCLRKESRVQELEDQPDQLLSFMWPEASARRFCFA